MYKGRSCNTKAKVAFRSENGHYLVAEWWWKKLNCNRKARSTWETFELIDRGNNRYALKTYHNTYVCAEGGGGREGTANRNRASTWETFEIQR